MQLIAYTSLLHADTSPLDLAEEYRQTEADLEAAGILHVILRNGWYTENYTASIPGSLIVNNGETVRHMAVAGAGWPMQASTTRR